MAQSPHVLKVSETIKPGPVKKKRLVKKYLIMLAVLTGVGGASGGGYLFYSKSQNPPGSGPEAVKYIQDRVAKHYLLPSGETPALATVTDKRKLTTKIFQHAENGDKILIYQENQIAIIYRPDKDRIVAVGPVDIDKLPANQKPSK